MKKKNWNLIIGLIITGIFLAMAIIGRFWTPYSTTAMSAMEMNQAPSLAHWMGTDNFGRDIFSRVMNGSGSTFIIAVCTVTFGCIVGTIVGALTGYYGGLFDNIIMRLNDILLSFPSILLALIFISFLGPGSYNIIVALGILFVPSFARIVRSEVIRAKELDFVKSARIMGVGRMRIIFRHILPNARVSILTSAAIGFNNAVLAEASMSFLRITPLETSLGYMLSEAQGMLATAPWYALSTGLVIALLVFGVGLIGEGLQQRNKEA